MKKGTYGYLALRKLESGLLAPSIVVNGSFFDNSFPLKSGNTILIVRSIDTTAIGEVLRLGCPLKSVQDDFEWGDVYPHGLFDLERWKNLVIAENTQVELIEIFGGDYVL